MYKEKDSVVFLLLFFILLPYLMTVLILGRKACPLSREISLEEYVPAVTASQISWDYSKEAIKVQTVAARSNLYLLQDTDKEESVIQEAVNYIRKQDMNSLMMEKYQVFLEAARETRGQVLKEKGEVREIPYHAVSGGMTRDGTEILGEAYGYLSSADTSGSSRPFPTSMRRSRVSFIRSRFLFLSSRFSLSRLIMSFMHPKVPIQKDFQISINVIKSTI